MSTSSLTNSQAEIIRQLLIDEGQADDLDPNTQLPLGPWPIYVSNEPSTPDNCVTIYDTTGIVDARTMADGEIVEHRGFQVRLRSINHQIGQQKLNAIRVWLSESVVSAFVTIDTNEYLICAIAKFGTVMYIGVDNPATKRSVFTLNATIAIKAQ